MLAYLVVLGSTVGRDSSLWPSVIAAASGLAGVVVGGLITRSISSQAEDKRAEASRQLAKDAAAEQRARDDAAEARQRNREHLLARGVARVLRMRFRQIGSQIQTGLDGKFWPPRASVPEAPLPLEDWKLLVTVLTEDELLAVDTAEYSARNILAMRDVAVGDELIASLDDKHAPMLIAVKDVLDEAETALRRVSEERP